jgi:hypothetical protein
MIMTLWALTASLFSLVKLSAHEKQVREDGNLLPPDVVPHGPFSLTRAPLVCEKSWKMAMRSPFCGNWLAGQLYRVYDLQ